MAFEAGMRQVSEFTNRPLFALVFNLVAFGLFGLPLAPVAAQLGCTIEDTRPEGRFLAGFCLLVLGAVLFFFGHAQFQFFDLAELHISAFFSHFFLVRPAQGSTVGEEVGPEEGPDEIADGEPLGTSEVAEEGASDCFELGAPDGTTDGALLGTSE
eukprot:CAMPEP_0194268356 /NCGR_PEP_ID=MMETSP0169-20130528/2705_1 /TAXON_ID=218684 /ORGANISM="Corethron pennatum, Strain L29A3" /LENGTH=155 /DNA_ID=CAMNT_0039009561 /DNA_START=161 /DNA_END=626 /DNA_ORIENTATION=+